MAAAQSEFTYALQSKNEEQKYLLAVKCFQINGTVPQGE